MAVETLLKARSLDDCWDFMRKYPEDFCLIAGGTDVCVKIREGDLKETALLDISDLVNCLGIEVTETAVGIGSAVKFADITQSPILRQYYPGLVAAVQTIGAPQIRHMGTLGGNLANGSPAADSAPPLLALEATLEIVSEKGKRSVALKDFYLGKGKTVLGQGEILTRIWVPKPEALERVSFAKLGLRNALAIARLSIAVNLQLDESLNIVKAVVASGAIGLNPMREPEIEALLLGRRLDEQTTLMGAEAFSTVVATRLKGRPTCPFKQEAVKGVFTEAMGGQKR